MKKIPNKVLLACGLCVACFVLGGAVRLGANEFVGLSRLLGLLGAFGVAMETFKWGAREGYSIRGQSLGIQIEHALRSLVMAAIMVGVSAVAAAITLQVFYEVFWRH